MCRLQVFTLLWVHTICTFNLLLISCSLSANHLQLLEQATVEYNNVVRQVALLKSKVRNELKRSKSAPSLVSG